MKDLAALRTMIEHRLAELAPQPGGPSHPLGEAMRDAILSPGKRSRPFAVLLSARRFGAREADALDVACAFEIVHAASLVIDDLPCMDDADQRRGRQTTHRRFGEDAAVLAGVALLNESYRVIAAAPLPHAEVRRITAALAGSIGLDGLTGGQMRDLREVDGASPESLLSLNHGKTGALFCAAAEAGAIIGGASDREIACVSAWARHVGAAFQIRDDLLDGATAQVAGKDVGKDSRKPTFVSLLGVAETRRRFEEERAAAAAALAAIGGPGELGAFSDGLLTLPWLENERRLESAVG